tara:strand:+ start:12674 stop:15088 length:2415 start_codon:yes stop_codon:yes gene_type:complete
VFIGVVRFYLLAFIIACLAGCTGKVSTESSVQNAVEAMAQQSSVTLISNSTQSQNKCETGNKIVVQVALSTVAKFYCRDKSKLMDSVKLGPVCDGGVTIKNLTVNRDVKDCHELTVCGRSHSSAVDITKRIDGTTVQRLTFENLPWGCEGHIEASSDPKFESGEIQSISMQILPPSCPFCEAFNGVSCNQCSTASSGETMFVAGQIIPKTCTGNCAQCKYPPTGSPSASFVSSSEMVAHAGIRPFYTSGNAICGQLCTQIQQIRVCNNGKWVPGDDTVLHTQCQEPAPSSCMTGNSVGFFKGLTRKFGLNSGLQTMAAGGDGVTCAQCSAGSCATCTTAGGSQGYKLYTQTSVPNGSSCDSVSQCQTCVDNLFQGNPAYKYGSCSVLAASCTQRLLNSPVASGSKQTFYNGGSCDPIVLTCANGSWKDSNNAAVTQTTADSYSDQCVQSSDCVTKGGISILNNTNQYVFDTNLVDSTDNCYSTNHFRYIGCANGAVSPSDPGTSFKYKECKTKTCVDPRDPAKTINAGVVVSYWAVGEATCSSLPDPATYCNNNKVTFTCAPTGGAAVISPANATGLAGYTYSACKVPPSCSACVVNKTDANNINVSIGSSTMLFKNKQSDLCQSVGKSFTCQSSGNSSPKLVDSTGAGEKHEDYPYLNCSPTGGGDEGSLGGTGGGNGNDNGPGSAIKKRFGATDGSGGAGLGCVDAVSCALQFSGASLPTKTNFTPCVLPWPSRVSEIEFYGTIVAFSSRRATIASGTNDTVCVTKPDLCSNHRQSRTCQYPTWTGAEEFKYPNCVEKASCP